MGNGGSKKKKCQAVAGDKVPATRVRVRPAIRNDLPAASTGDHAPIAGQVILQAKSNKLICAAIDFGTTFTGYACSFASDPARVLTNLWSGTAIKTPTCVLMNPRKQFHSFGDEAQQNYRQLIKNVKHTNWYYFQNFKMKLYVKCGPLGKDMKLKDMTGKKMLALDVFTAAICYMKKHLLQVLNEWQRAVKITPGDIHWVITVPAIWDDLAKLFMRQAAGKAGIPTDLLTLALEPEAASLFCREAFGSAALPPGCRYVVLDLGGGTADLTCHEIQADGTLKELHKASGGAYGGTLVDDQFHKTLYSIFGAPLIENFKDSNMKEYFDLVKCFELKKRSFDGTREIRMDFPIRLIEMYEEDTGMTIDECMQQSPSFGKVSFKLGKIFITAELAKEYFETAVNNIIVDTNKIISTVRNIKTLIPVGGFSESPYVVGRLKKEYRNLVLMPKEPASVVLKGAVIYGHRTKAISSRVCKFTYGIARMMKFKDTVHRQDKLKKIDGINYCDDLFNKHIETGQQVSIDDDVQPCDYYPLTAGHSQAVLEVYASNRREVMYIDEVGCQLVGLIRLDIQAHNVSDKIMVKLLFGGTELVIEATEVRTKKVVQACIDFLG